MTGDFYVYLHRTVDTGRIFYVGKGRARRAQTRCGRSELWTRIATKHGFTVEFVAKGLTESVAFALETETIARYTGLCNFTDGGEGISGYRHTPETCERIRAAHAGRTQAPEVIAQRVEKLRGKKRSPEVCAAIGARNLGRKASTETRRKQSLARQGYSHSAETIAKVAAWHTGKKRSAEAIARMKAASAVVRAVVCVERALTFVSLTYAAEWMRACGRPKASKAAICAAASGRMQTAYGYRWEYA